MSFLFQCGVNSSNTSTTIPTDFLGNKLVAKANDKQIKCIDTERNALLDFKAMILRDPGYRLSAWGTKKEDDCCNWTGVMCNNEKGHVTDLHLGDWGLEGEISPSLLNLTHLNVLDLGSNSFNGSIPNTIGSLTELRYLVLSSNSFNGTIPKSFGFLNKLTALDLSDNSFSGNIPSDLSTFPGSSTLDLSSNNFYGPITNVSSTLTVLDLSKNNLCGGISFLCQIVEGSLLYLDLGYNSFSGQIPDCLWHLKNLIVLNLAQNNLSGRIPASVEYLIQLNALDLYDNNFSGELPLSWRNCTGLTFLNLGANIFSGNVPVWIGENLGLYVLSLGSNNLSGPIPLQFCQLENLQILDLSMNNLNGTIPACVSNLTSMVQEGSLETQQIHGYVIATSGSFGFEDYIDHAIVQWQGTRREFMTSNLRLLKMIDLSSNNLTGQIPKKLTDLRNLLALNLSKNALWGEIPQEIGQLKHLLTLDLSRNHFSGRIPSSISEMTSLNNLDLSYNNLTGRIPSSTQLQSFEASRYIGNAGLCGLPLSKYCPGDEGFQVPSIVPEREGDGEGDIDELERWFYIGGAIGFAIGFWIVCSTLLVYRRGRHTFFRFMDSVENWVYVKVVVFKAKFRRGGT